jgi:Tfp pilus assembly protein FimV
MATMAVVAAAIGAAAAWWFVGNRPTASSETVVNEVQTETATDALTAPIAPPESSSPLSNESPGTDGTGVRQIEGVKARNLNTAIPTAEVQSKAAPAEAVSRPTATPATPGERDYIMEADLGDVVLSLGYIVARRVNPFAEINGVEVYLGSEIEGFVVEAIEADRVVLRDKDGTLVLRVP